MNFWNKQKIKEALPSAKFYNFPENWSASGIIIWHEIFSPGDMLLVRGSGETRGLNIEKHLELVPECSAIAATNTVDYFKYNKPVIELCGSSSDALIQMARYIRKNFLGKVIGVTGSSGKSTTTQMIFDILSSRYKASSNILSKANTTWGIAWNMTRFGIDDAYWVIETSLGGGMSRNSAIVKPDYAIVMNVAPVHLTQNMQLSDIAEEKARIFNAMKENSTAILYKEMEHYDIVEKNARFKGLKIITFGESSGCDIQVVSDAENKFIVNGETYTLNSEAVGLHILLDMAAALAVAKEESLEIEQALNVLRNFNELSGRGESFDVNMRDDKNITVIDESYNANPLSMKSAITAFGQKYKNRQKVLVLGDMAQCGVNSAGYHKGLAEYILDINPRKVLLCGNDIKILCDEIKNQVECKYFENIPDLIKNISTELADGDCVMIKSSHSSGLHRVKSFLQNENGRTK